MNQGWNFGGDSPIGTNCLLPLPIEMLSFNVDNYDDQPNLQWITSTENGNKGWNIQRSSDGNDWESIDWISGARNSTTQNSYTYVDRSGQKGRLFFRLEQIDEDESKSYSEVRTILLETQNVSFYPNPVVNDLFIRTNKKSSYQIVDLLGQMLNTGEMDHTESVDVFSLAQGYYYLKMGEEVMN